MIKVLTNQADVAGIANAGWYYYEPGNYLIYASADRPCRTVTIPSNVLTKQDIDDYSLQNARTKVEGDILWINHDDVCRQERAAFKIGKVFSQYIDPRSANSTWANEVRR